MKYGCLTSFSHKGTAATVIFTIYGVTASRHVDSLKKVVSIIQIKGCYTTSEQSCEENSTSLFKLFHIRIDKTAGTSDLFINYNEGAVVKPHTADLLTRNVLH